MTFEQKPFGTTRDGREVTAWTLRNHNGMSAVILDYGCTIQSVVVPDCTGRPVDVVLGYNTLEEYENNGGYLGAVVGRVGNRIGKGQFTLNGKEYQLATNDRGNHLHGSWTISQAPSIPAASSASTRRSGTQRPTAMSWCWRP